MQKEKDDTDDIEKYVIDYDQLKFERVIGVGGFGEVSFGYHVPSGVKVAIKKLFDVNETERMTELYYREIRTLALGNNHFFLLPFIGFTSKPPYCIVTKYIPNGSLYDLLHENNQTLTPPPPPPPPTPASTKPKNDNKKSPKKLKTKKKNRSQSFNDHDNPPNIADSPTAKSKKITKLSPTQKTFIAYGIAVGMRFLHEKRIIHRDLKTQNILIDDNCIPVISDFGSSRFSNGNAPKTCSFGTTNYMAPEFIQSEEYDLPVDVYSYGMILWEMLTEEVPFFGKESAQVIYTVAIKQNRPKIPENTPPNLENLIQKCWAQDPQDRPGFDQIVNLFLSKKVEFPGNDQNEFNYLIKHYGTGNRLVKRRFSDVPQYDMDSSGIENISLKNENATKSVAVFLSKVPHVASVQQKTDASLAALDGNDAVEIEKAICFFESIIDDKIILQIDLWSSFLNFLRRQYSSGSEKGISIFRDGSASKFVPIELVNRAEKLVLRFASTYEILDTIKKVPDLYQYLLPNGTFLTLFLYIVNYVPGVIDDQIVNRIFKLFLDKNCSMKAMTLICRIVHNSPQPSLTKYILDTLQTNVSTFVDLVGGHLIIELLLYYKYLNIGTISLFNRSSVDENVISSYKSLFSINGPPELFSLQKILQHCVSPNEELRNLALDFIRRFAFGAEGDPLRLIIAACFKAVFNFESEKAALLLVRVSSDPKRCISIVNSGFVNEMLGAKPSTALKLLKVFLTIIIADERCKKFFFQHQMIPLYFANVARNYDEDAIISLCWSLNQIKMTSELAVNLTKSEFIPILCDIITSPKVSKNHSRTPTKMNENSDDNLSRFTPVNSDTDDEFLDEASSSMSSMSANSAYGLYIDPDRLKWFLSAIVKVSVFADCDRYNKVVKLLFELIDKKSIISRICFITLSAISSQTSTHETFIDYNIFALFNRYNDTSEEAKSFQKQIIKNIRDGGKFMIP